MKNWLRRKLINFLVGHLYNTITEDDILKVNRGVMSFRGQPLTNEATEAIKAQAGRLMDGVLWKYLKRDLQYLANLRMFRTSTNEYDMLAGKVMLDVVDKIEKRLTELAKQ